MTGITVGQAGDALVAIKQAHDPDHRARLRHEADMLGRLDHPGVVRFVGFDEGPPAALHTAFVGPDSWRTSTASLDGFAALTATIADLHDAGVVHGDLRAEHVLLDADHRPILCGFADAGAATAERMHADRTALAAMLRDEASRQPNNVSHRLRDAAGVLEEPALPTRAAIRLLDDQSPSLPQPRTGPSRRSVAIAGAALAVLAAVVATVVAVGGGGAGDSATLDAEPNAPVVETPIPAPTTTTVPAVPPSAPAEPATVVVHNGRQYGVGTAGDLVHVADWTCSGDATPAVLRPTTGEVAVFTEWPEPDGSLLPSLTVVIDDAIDFAIADEPCPALRVRTPAGSRLIEVPT